MTKNNHYDNDKNEDIDEVKEIWRESLGLQQYAQVAEEYNEQDNGFTLRFRPVPENSSTSEIKKHIKQAVNPRPHVVMEGLKKVNGKLQYTLTVTIRQANQNEEE